VVNEKFNWQVLIPPDTTATVDMPLKNGGAVTERGQPVEGRRAVKFVRVEEGRAIYEIESSLYDFQSAL